MKKILLLLLCINTNIYLLLGQKPVGHLHNDSLQQLIEKSSQLSYQYKIKESLEHAIQAAKYSNRINSHYYKGHAHYLMGYNYQILADYENAEKNFRKALEFAELANDSILTLWSVNGLGNVFSDGYKNLSKAVTYYLKAVEIGKILDDPYEYLPPVINLAWSYIDVNKYEEAYPYLMEADDLLLVTKDMEAYCGVNFLKGKYYLYKNDLKKSKHHFTLALTMAKENEMLLEMSYIYEGRAELYRALNMMDSAYSDIKAYQAYKDQLYTKEQLKQIETAKAGFEVEEYEQELERTKKEKDYQTRIAKNNRFINIVSGIALVFLLGAVFFFYRGYHAKKKLSDVLKNKNKELITAKTKAEELTRIKSQFISTVSHELRTPLYGVVGITSLLLEEDDVLEKHKKLLSSLKFSGDYLLNLINNVLQISKIEAKNIKLANTPTNIFKLCQNILNSLEYQALSKHTELILESPSNLPETIDVDSLRLSEILINLIGNAIKFTENGKIWLRIKMIDTNDDQVHLRFEVEDNGLGIPESKQDYVFEKFSQVNRESNKLEGTGLGLSIVKNLVQMMDSSIHLDSKEGRGTRFYFDLKLHIIYEESKNSHYNSENGVTEVYRRILIAEDNKINQIVTKNLLNLIGYDCTIVENGFNALQMMKKEDFDLVLMDLNMPYLNGIEASKRIREFDQSTPIVALTASELEEIREDCLAVGMNDVINKPLNKNDLKNIIAKNLLP
ncbi:ATP-binding protein [Aquimarina sp. W85]|uniref:tetratricopeptide repeat-containing hybrid sensor histidine kinase/response regulator n=1 Tax=Aquimarina rhodophyticola TaxID=3342246 RepID=UPI00366BE588